MTKSYPAELAARPTTHHAPRDLVTLLELSRELSVYPDLDTSLRRMETAALHVIDCERLTVFVNEPFANNLHSLFATGGHDIRTPVDRGIAGAANAHPGAAALLRGA